MQPVAPFSVDGCTVMQPPVACLSQYGASRPVRIRSRNLMSGSSLRTSSIDEKSKLPWPGSISDQVVVIVPNSAYGTVESARDSVTTRPARAGLRSEPASSDPEPSPGLSSPNGEHPATRTAPHARTVRPETSRSLSFVNGQILSQAVTTP